MERKDKFYSCKYGREEWEQFEGDIGNPDYDYTRICDKACNPDKCEYCSEFVAREKNKFNKITIKG